MLRTEHSVCFWFPQLLTLVALSYFPLASGSLAELFWLRPSTYEIAMSASAVPGSSPDKHQRICLFLWPLSQSPFSWKTTWKNRVVEDPPVALPPNQVECELEIRSSMIAAIPQKNRVPIQCQQHCLHQFPVNPRHQNLQIRLRCRNRTITPSLHALVDTKPPLLYSLSMCSVENTLKIPDSTNEKREKNHHMVEWTSTYMTGPFSL